MRPQQQRPQRPVASGNPAFRDLYRPDSEAYVPPAEEMVIPLAERKYIATLTDSCCRWPIGDPQHEEFHFCGKTKVAGLPYCDVHARRAFQPPQARRRDQTPPVYKLTLPSPVPDKESV